MFIKVIVRPARSISAKPQPRYVNSDHIEHVDADNGVLLFANASQLNVTPDSAAYFLACVEAKAAHTEEAIEPPSLKSRIAQALRWDYPHGALVSYLTSVLPQETAGEIEDKLAELEAENTAIQIGPFWYHASNRPAPVADPVADTILNGPKPLIPLVTASLDPSTAGEASDSTLEESSENSSSRNSSD